MTSDERQQLLAAYADLRVTDVRDGMDTLLMHRTGSMHPAVRPLWRTRVCGLARTVRYVPYDGVVPQLAPDEYWAWVAEYLRATSLWRLAVCWCSREMWSSPMAMASSSSRRRRHWRWRSTQTPNIAATWQRGGSTMMRWACRRMKP